jgi:hypothetical protein
MPSSVKLDDIIEALEGAGDQHSYYLDKHTGEIALITNEEMEAAEEDELISEFPEWQRESILKAREILKSEDFVRLPDQFDINEYQIMEDFCLECQDRNVGQSLLGLIKGSGAFRRFKTAIHSMDVEKDWYQFRRTELEKLAIQWLEQEGLAYAREEVTEISETSM